MTNKESNYVKTVERSLEIVDALQECDGARVTELAEYLDAPVSTVHAHLQSLKRNRYVAQEGDTYHVGLRFLTRGGYARKRKAEYSMAGDLVDELARETGEQAQFATEEHGRAIHLYKGLGDRAVKLESPIGKESFMHASAAGKAILAHLPVERIEAIIDEWGLKPLTEQSITDRDELFEELETIREQGYSINDEETHDGLRAIGVPVKESEHQVLGAFSISGPKVRLELRTESLDVLRGAANELEFNIS